MFRLRAFAIIYGERFVNCNYRDFCQEVGYHCLAERREALSRKFFITIIRLDSCIHHLIPEKRNEIILSRV